MSYDEKLDEILARLDSIEAKLGAVPPPQSNDGLYWYKRPAAGVPRYGYGVRLGPDGFTPEELRLRALYCVRWDGEIAKSGPYEDEVWAEIAALQNGDAGLIKRYEMLDPDFVGFALLTNILSPVKYDGFIGGMQRDGMKGITVQSWAEEQAAIMRGGAAPGIGNE